MLHFRYLTVLAVYILFMLIVAGLTIIQKRLPSKVSSNDRPHGIRKKAPVYMGIVLIFIIALICPQKWNLPIILMAVLLAFASSELAGKLLPKENFPYELPALAVVLLTLAGFLETAAFMVVMLVVLLLMVMLYALIKQGRMLSLYYLALGGILFYLLFCSVTFIWVWQKDPTGLTAIFLFLVVSVSDIFSQITGEIFGRLKLAPILSPAKTIEGAIGGLLFASAAGMGISYALDWDLLRGVLLGLALGVAGAIGDLIESGWKRALGIKDFSGLLGVQGGVLDRFDSLLFAAPVFYFLIAFFP